MRGFRYKPVGWKGESHRHYLAAKFGSAPSRRMFATKMVMEDPFKAPFSVSDAQFKRVKPVVSSKQGVPKPEPFPEEKAKRKRGTVRGEAIYKEALYSGVVVDGQRRGGRIQDLVRKTLREEQPIYRMAEDVRAGVFSAKYDVDGTTMTLQEAMKDARFASTLRPLAEQKALELTAAGVKLPGELKELVPEQKKILGLELPFQKQTDVGRAIEAIEKQRAKENEGALTRWTKETGKGFIINTPEVLASTVQSGIDKVDLGLTEARRATTDRKLFSGTVGQVDQLRTTPFFTTNALIGDEEDGSFRPEMQQPLSDQLDELMGIRAPQKTESDRVEREVASIHSSKDKLAKADISAFEDGKKAFKKGDREGLISAITKLEGEEQTLVDRMNLVMQTHAEVQSPSHRLMVHKGGGGPLSFFGGDGGSKLADQTEKVNEVRREIKESASKVNGRKQLLLYDLARMNAVTPPATSRPVSVQVVSTSDGVGGKLSQAAKTLMKPLSGFEVSSQ